LTFALPQPANDRERLACDLNYLRFARAAVQAGQVQASQPQHSSCFFSITGNSFVIPASFAALDSRSGALNAG
jgi:hypothetical protein